MAHIARVPTTMTADEFIETDQCEFGDAWRYDLVDGVIEAHAAPSDKHALMLSNLIAALHGRLKSHEEGCRVETGGAVIPARKIRNTARIPDALARCKGLPRVTFEIVSPSELRHVKQRDKKREDVKQVEGVVQIIEIYQHTMAAHVHNRIAAGIWEFISVSGKEAGLDMPSLGISIPLIDLYEDVMPADEIERT
jgi:hypothetical protein